MMKTLRRTVCTVLLPAFLFLLFSACEKTPATVEQTDVAMGSVVAVKLYATTEDALKQLAPIEAVRAVDNLISATYEKSDVSAVNKAGGAPVQVNEKTYTYLRRTAEIYASSKGKAAVTCGALTRLWGFDTDAFHLPTEAEISAAVLQCDDSKLVFDEQNTVRTAAGCLLNLGSVGKGIACDEAVAYLRAASDNVSGGTVSVGGSVAVYGQSPSGALWSVGIRNPFGTANEYFAILKTPESFISTSGNYEKVFTAENGERYHHILDLTTGYPVQTELASVTVVAGSGLESDALSTLCFILGKEASLELLQAYGAQAVFVYQDKTVYATQGIKDCLQITNSEFTVL